MYVYLALRSLLRSMPENDHYVCMNMPGRGLLVHPLFLFSLEEVDLIVDNSDRR